MDWFNTLSEIRELPPSAAAALHEHGFTVIDDVRVGSTTTRVTDFVNRGAAFDDIYIYPRLPLFGFILMIDEFRPDNGATRFVPGSHRRPGPPNGVPADRGRMPPETRRRLSPLARCLLSIEDVAAECG